MIHGTGIDIPNNVVAAAGRFTPRGDSARIVAYGKGNINDTFLVAPERGETAPYILQRINRHVFRRPDLVMSNIRLLTDHVRARLENFPLDAGRRWDVPRVLPTREGADHWIDSEGSFWRALSFINGARSFDTIRSEMHAREIGYALGLFHRLVSDLPAERLADTLEGFHVTPLYLRHYDEVCAGGVAGGSPEVKYCHDFVARRRSGVRVLESAKEQGRIRIRPIHGDPKVNNILVDASTGQAVSIIDLDTVKPGLVQYDIGDCLRSCCNLLGENMDRLEEVHFDPDCCRAILGGYFSSSGNTLTGGDRHCLFDAVRLIAFELGLRFFTDYLEGNTYFKVAHPDHNLERALVQFRLTESIEAQESVIRTIVEGVK